jgi:hypothetical protein
VRGYKRPFGETVDVLAKDRQSLERNP